MALSFASEYESDLIWIPIHQDKNGSLLRTQVAAAKTRDKRREPQLNCPHSGRQGLPATELSELSRMKTHGDVNGSVPVEDRTRAQMPMLEGAELDQCCEVPNCTGFWMLEHGHTTVCFPMDQRRPQV